jgi:hypothetical protein
LSQISNIISRHKKRRIGKRDKSHIALLFREDPQHLSMHHLFTSFNYSFIYKYELTIAFQVLCKFDGAETVNKIEKTRVSMSKQSTIVLLAINKV